MMPDPGEGRKVGGQGPGLADEGGITGHRRPERIFSGKLPVTYPKGSLVSILQAMDAAHAAQVPVVVIQHASHAPDAATFRHGTYGWELHAEVKKRPRDLLIEKTLPGSFSGTTLDTWLRESRHRLGDHCRLHDPDVLRHDRTAGIP